MCILARLSVSTLVSMQGGWSELVVGVTVDEGAVEPLHVIALGEAEQHLIGQDGDGEQEHCTHRHRQGKCAQP